MSGKTEQNTGWLSREMLDKGTVQDLARSRDGENSTILSPEALLESRRRFIPDDYDGPDIWVFGYGSLIWNPLISFEQREDARLFGYHKRFCLWTRIGRGSPDCPGLVLALDKGGSVRGHAFRIKAEKAAAECDILWKREMLNNSYAPRWMKARCENGQQITALGFVIRHELPSYAGRLSEFQTAEVIARAEGFLGPCCQYLFETQAALEQAGIHDPYMQRLSRLVRQLQSS